jgi:lipopolysaccharide assembly protein A
VFQLYFNAVFKFNDSYLTDPYINKGVGLLRTQWLLILALVFALVTAVFAVINVDPVQVNFLFSTTNIPLILIIVGSTLLGGIIVGIFGFARQYQLQKKIRLLENELKNNPLKTPTPPHLVTETKQNELSPLPIHE